MDTGGKTSLIAKLLSKGAAFSTFGKHQEALEAFDEILGIAPKNVDALSFKCGLLNKLGRHQEAQKVLNALSEILLETLDNVLKVSPRHTEALNEKVDILNKLGRHQEALSVASEILKNEDEIAGQQTGAGVVSENEKFEINMPDWLGDMKIIGISKNLDRIFPVPADDLENKGGRNSISYQHKTLKEYAQHYYNLGLNITCVSNVKNEFNSSNDNFYLKAPNHKWDDLWSRRQTIEEFNGYEWANATGFGLATGFNNLLVIDLDDCSHNFLIQTLEQLGLPTDYEWVVLSGSRKGYHIYVLVNDLVNVFPVIPVVRLYPKEAYSGLVKKVELLIRLHSILPPSVHPTQNKYEFINCSAPARSPAYIGVDKIQLFIDTYFDPAKQENKKIYKKKVRVSEYQCPDKPHGWRAIFLGCSSCIAEAERKRAENANALLEEQEERRINKAQKRQEKWNEYLKLEKEIRAMPKYAVWRQDVLARYARKCAINDPLCKGGLEVDHFPRSLYSLVSMCEIRTTMQAYECAALWDVNNGGVLCKSHHDQTKSSMSRASRVTDRI